MKGFVCFCERCYGFCVLGLIWYAIKLCEISEMWFFMCLWRFLWLGLNWCVFVLCGKCCVLWWLMMLVLGFVCFTGWWFWNVTQQMGLFFRSKCYCLSEWMVILKCYSLYEVVLVWTFILKWVCCFLLNVNCISEWIV